MSQTDWEIPILYQGDLYRFWHNATGLLLRVELQPRGRSVLPTIEDITQLPDELIHRYESALVRIGYTTEADDPKSEPGGKSRHSDPRPEREAEDDDDAISVGFDW